MSALGLISGRGGGVALQNRGRGLLILFRKGIPQRN
jgi:hypothetical protein